MRQRYGQVKQTNKQTSFAFGLLWISATARSAHLSVVAHEGHVFVVRRQVVINGVSFILAIWGRKKKNNTKMINLMCSQTHCHTNTHTDTQDPVCLWSAGNRLTKRFWLMSSEDCPVSALCRWTEPSDITRYSLSVEEVTQPSCLLAHLLQPRHARFSSSEGNIVAVTMQTLCGHIPGYIWGQIAYFLLTKYEL